MDQEEGQENCQEKLEFSLHVVLLLLVVC
jgi:hypothetical protein